jgi:effector-binding domain-containing protein
LVQVPARRVVAVRYSGLWSAENYKEALEQLTSFAQQRGLQLTGEPVYARYDPPFMPWFLRRNEILVEIAR